MKIVVAYICVTHAPTSPDFAGRFIGTYLANPPGIEHETVILCNGGMPNTELGMMFDAIGARIFPRENDPGWDVSAYIDFARCTDADMLVCFGESVYFHREGWLKRLADAWQEFGPGMYGLFGSHAVRGHLQTTAFACPPRILKAYPHRVTTHAARYEFEHGNQALWRLANISGLPTMLVTWDGAWRPGQWRFPKNIIWRGDQTNCLAFCNHTDRYETAPPSTRQDWQRSIDRPFV